MNHTQTAAYTQSSTLLPLPTADTFGACSTLFELGGMIVIHDPSGCNSTYTTHDEPRWYDTDALLFISALTEYDAILGRDDKLIADIEQAAQEFHPNFICILPSQIAHLIATDLPAISRIIQRDTNIPTFTLPTNSMHPYDRGIQYALEKLAEHLIEITHPSPPRASNLSSKPAPRINLLGLTPLDYHWQRTLPSLKAFLHTHNLAFAASLTLSTTLAAIETNAPTADVSLVLTKSALPAAQLLERALHIPYIAAIPYPPIADEVAAALHQAAKDKKSRILYGCGKLKMVASPSNPSESTYHTSANTILSSGGRGLCDSERSGEHPASRCKTNLREDGGFHKETFSDATAGSASVVSVGSTRLTANTTVSPRPRTSNLLLTEPLAASSLSAALALSHHPFTPLLPPTSESSFQAALSTATTLLADPLYFPLAPASTKTIALPRRAISGRTFESIERNLLDPADWTALLAELQA